MNSSIHCIDAGCLPYSQALCWQKELAVLRRKREIGDYIIFLEHPPVFTLGRRDAFEDLLVDETWLRKHHMDLQKSDRGGRMTYHGPGQLVGYFIFRIKDSIPKFVWKIEEAIIRALATFHLEVGRDKNHPGVWLEDRKIAALGLHIEKGVTTHGFSLNVSCDLKPFRYIRPCGITGRDVTSLEKELGWSPSMRDVKHQLLKAMASVFESSISLEGSFETIPE